MKRHVIIAFGLSAITALAICITDDCFLCIAAGEQVKTGTTKCKGQVFDVFEVTQGECWVGSSREVEPDESGKDAPKFISTVCTVAIAQSTVEEDINGNCVRVIVPIPPPLDTKDRRCDTSIPDPKAGDCKGPPLP